MSGSAGAVRQVLVTGARGGIGEAVVDVAVERGYRVLAHDIVPVADTTAQADRVSSIAGDLLDPEHIASLRSHLAAQPLQAVIASHGVEGAGAVAALRPERVERNMAINFSAVVALYEGLRDLLEAGRGTFVVVVSQAGLVGEEANAAYCASKFAVVGWARSAARRGARIRLLCPGCVETPMLHAAIARTAEAMGVSAQDLYDELMEGIGLRRPARPREMAAAAVALAELGTDSPVTAAVTGGEVLY
jgi:NAD(P)-dependent dehydrogenase (short-subunit alcohol dehydrogenase family)